jgi:hypothetical protein
LYGPSPIAPSKNFAELLLVTRNASSKINLMKWSCPRLMPRVLFLLESPSPEGMVMTCSLRNALSLL